MKIFCNAEFILALEKPQLKDLFTFGDGEGGGVVVGGCTNRMERSVILYILFISHSKKYILFHIFFIFLSYLKSRLKVLNVERLTKGNQKARENGRWLPRYTKKISID